MNYRLAALLPLSALSISIANAQPADSTEALRAEVEALRARLDAMDESAESESRLDFSGDLRYRHESISDDAATTDRHRHRIRARFNLEAELSDDVSVGMTLATGASNPVSANQTLGGGFSRKDFGVDRAYFAWRINDELTMRGGKMGLPVFRPGGYHLIFDSDLNPEGLFLGYDGDRVFANIGGFWVQERGSEDDAILYALQGGFRHMIGDGPELTIGGSYYDYRNTQGYQPFYLGNPEGNSVDGSGNLLYDYNIAEVFAQVEFEVGGQPLRVFADYVDNREADQNGKGQAIGIRWRSASNPGDWEIGWAYEDLEADAVIATFTDSDFIGGGTDGKGTVMTGAYRLRENVRLNGTYFLNDVGGATRTRRDYQRLQLDVTFMF